MACHCGGEDVFLLKSRADVPIHKTSDSASLLSYQTSACDPPGWRLFVSGILLDPLFQNAYLKRRRTVCGGYANGRWRLLLQGEEG